MHLPGGGHVVAGTGAPVAHMHIKSRVAMVKMILHSTRYIGECYMDGEWEAGEGGIERVVEVLFRNMALLPRNRLYMRLMRPLSFLLREWNWSRRSHRNASYHYDVPEEVYRRFLDSDMQYSCAYFDHGDETLEQAQAAKKEHIARKLLLKPGDRVLDIGSGWGGMALYLAGHYGVSVTGLTLSAEQLRVSRARAEAEGLADRVRFELEDYRQHRGSYDAIVSVGMFEHVGRPQFHDFFEQSRKLLAPGGRMLLHTIGRAGTPHPINAWINQYIFPGGYLPALSELARAIEPSGLVTADVEVLHSHYAHTLAHWRERFAAHRAEIAAIVGERFCRMWEFYLLSAQGGFRWLELVIFQVQLTRDAHTVPLTRDYLYHPGASDDEIALHSPKTVRLIGRRPQRKP
jgi:cyclopropane-fatty-acyl-phospholipid synthase